MGSPDIEPIDESLFYRNNSYINGKSPEVKNEREVEANLSEEIPVSSSLDIPVVASPLNNPGGCESLDMLPTAMIKVKREIQENQGLHSKCGFSDFKKIWPESEIQGDQATIAGAGMNYILLISQICYIYVLLQVATLT